MEDTTSTVTTDTSSTASVDTSASSEATAQAQSEPKAPRSFGEAVDQLKARDEAASTDREPATTAQETQPAETKDKPLTSKKGPIPFEVHEKALTNARSKALEEAKPQIEQEIRQRYAWAETVEEADREELTALYRGLKTDLIGTLTTLIDNASQHPEHAKTLRSQAARLLSAARRVQGEQSSDDDEPQPDIPLEDGRAVYSAEQQRKRDAWLIQKVSAQFDQKLQPFQQDRERAQQAERQRATYDAAAQTIARYKDKPHFAEHKADIFALMERDASLSLGEAYAEILATRVLPKASQTERAAVLADLNHKAGAGTLNPQTTTTAASFRPDGKFTVDRIKQFFEAGA